MQGQAAGQHRMATRWCFTLNNPRPDEEQALMGFIQALMTKTPASNEMPFTYLIFEKEHEGEGEGTPHLQGFFRLFAQKQRMWIQNHIPGFARAHLEVARGTDEQNRLYCSKEHKAHEAGEYRQANYRSEKRGVWHDIADMIESGATIPEIRAEYPGQYMSHQAGITQWVVEVHEREHGSEAMDMDLQQKNIWVWGPSGTGKSRWAHRLPGTKYMKIPNRWWDGYNGQDVVIMEDLDPECCKNGLAHKIKLWADRYLFTAEVKGGTRCITPSYKLVITSNYHPNDCFANPEDLAAIMRRFTVCKLDMQGAEPDWPRQNG